MYLVLKYSVLGSENDQTHDRLGSSRDGFVECKIFVCCSLFSGQAILTGPKRDNFNRMCTQHTHDFVDLMAGSLRPLVQHMIGEKEFVALKDEIAQQMIQNLPVAIRCSF